MNRQPLHNLAKAMVTFMLFAFVNTNLHAQVYSIRKEGGPMIVKGFLGKFGGKNLFYEEHSVSGGFAGSFILIRTDTITKIGSISIDFDFTPGGTPTNVTTMKGNKEVKVPTVVQCLYVDICIPHMPSCKVNGNTLKITYTANCVKWSGRPVVYNDTWTWTGSVFELTDHQTTHPYDDKLKLYLQYLKAEKIDEALSLGLDPSPDGATCEDIFQPYVEAIHAKALRAYKSGDKFSAAAIALGAFDNSPVRACSEGVPDVRINTTHYFFTSEAPGHLPEQHVAITPNNTTIVNDFGFFLAEAGFYEKAYQLLRQVIERNPEREVAYLNLADSEYSQYKEKYPEFSLRNYKKYVALMEKKGLKDKIPPRVLERIKEMESLKKENN